MGKHYDWLVLTTDTGVMKCLRCGGEHALGFPVDVRFAAGVSKLFIKLHRDCKPPPPNPEIPLP